MENILKDILDCPSLLIEQIRGRLFATTAADGPVLVVVDANRRFKASHPGRVGFLLGENEGLLDTICDRLDDGEDPLILNVANGCAAATQLASERTHCGYLLVFLEGYTPDSIGANLPLIELIFAQAEAVCDLIEKNNQLHHLRLVHLNRTSSVMARSL